MNMLDKCEDDNDNAVVNTPVVSFRLPPQHPKFSTSHTLISDHAITRTITSQESTSLQDTHYDFFFDFLNGLKPFAIKIQEIIMPNPSILPPPPLLPPPPPLSHSTAPTSDKPKVPSFATRRAACTHLTMERLYGDFTCNVCSRFSNFGWLYCCTQDHVPDVHATPGSISEPLTPPPQHVNGNGDRFNEVDDLPMLPPAIDEDPRQGWEDTSMPTSELSPWIEQAIKDGHYTPEQVTKLRAQKQHVVDTARAAIAQFDQSQANNTISPTHIPTMLQSVDANPHLPFPVTNEVHDRSVTSLPTHNSAPSALQPKLRMFPYCKFCACQLCRPTHRDRAWQRFNDVFEKDHEIPFIHYEDSNRPMASASIMSKIGLRPPRLPKRPLLRAFDSRAFYSRNEDGQIVFNNNNNGSVPKSADPAYPSTDIADMKVEPESKGFRESMKRAFKSMLVTRRPSSRSIRKRKARDESETSDEDAVEFDMGLWKELNDELLKEASGVPLPGKDSIEGLSKEVGEMGIKDVGGGMGEVGGVAVTEEAADLGTPDVIMSV